MEKIIKETYDSIIKDSHHIYPDLRSFYATSILYKLYDENEVDKYVGPYSEPGYIYEERKIDICRLMLKDIPEEEYRKLSDEYKDIEKFILSKNLISEAGKYWENKEKEELINVVSQLERDNELRRRQVASSWLSQEAKDKSYIKTRERLRNEIEALENKNAMMKTEQEVKIQILENENKVIKEELEKQERAMELRTICIVCLENNRNILFTPCNHIVCCNICSNQLITCPFCRENIIKKILVIMP